MRQVGTRKFDGFHVGVSRPELGELVVLDEDGGEVESVGGVYSDHGLA